MKNSLKRFTVLILLLLTLVSAITPPGASAADPEPEDDPPSYSVNWGNDGNDDKKG